MTDRFVVDIPGTPTRALSPNGRVHWRVRYRDATAARNAAYYATLAARQSDPTPARFAAPGASQRAAGVSRDDGLIRCAVTVAWEWGRKSMDADNALACVKAHLDGVAAALGVDDKRFQFEPVRQERDPDGQGFVRVEIERIEGGQP